MYAGYLALNSMLVLAFFWAFAHGSPVLSDDADIPGSFNDQFNVDLRGDGLPLRRIHHRYLFKRDLHHELFEPRSELQLDVLLGHSVQTFNFAHDNGSYVNLELPQAHGLLRHDQQICSGPDHFNKTILSLSFRDHGSYTRAKQQWQGREGLLFVVEDASCIQGQGTRSIYLAESITFSEDRPGQPVAVKIQAEHKRLALDAPDTATTLELSMKTLEQFKEQHYDTFKLHRRRSNPDFNPPDFPHLSDLPHLSHLTHLSNLPDPIHSLTSKIGSEASSLIGHITSAAGSLVSEAIQEVEDMYEEITKGLEKGISHDLNLKLDWQRSARKVPLEGLQNLGMTPKLAVIDSYATGSIAVGFSLKFSMIPLDSFKDLEGPTEDKFGQYVSSFLKEVSIWFQAREEIEIGLQFEIYLQAGIEYFCAWWLWPVPGFAACSLSVLPADISQNVNNPFKDFNHDEWGKVNGGTSDKKGASAWKAMGVKMLMENGIGLWTRVGSTAAVNFTTPGVDLKIPKGWKSLIGFKNGKTWREHMQTEVTWREPHIGVEKGKVYANVAIGPRITLGGALPGTKKMAFDLQARLDMPKIELAAGQEKDVDKNCQKKKPEEGGFAHGLGVWLDASIGLFAAVTLPFGTQFSTNWLGKRLGDNFNGFAWTKKLIGFCSNEDDPNNFGIKWLTDKLNEEFKHLFGKTHSDQKKEDMSQELPGST